MGNGVWVRPRLHHKWQSRCGRPMPVHLRWLNANLRSCHKPCLPACVADWGGLGAAPGPATLTTASGRTISADWVVRAIGQKAASAPLAASLGKERLASHGAVLVEPTLQVGLAARARARAGYIWGGVPAPAGVQLCFQGGLQTSCVKPSPAGQVAPHAQPHAPPSLPGNPARR